MKRDQKGFTIVELLIAIAILSIVVASVCGFILVGSRSYAAGNSDISVQQEAQLALNQMSDVLIDTTRNVTYTGYDAGGTTSETALKDAEFSFTPENKSLVMINGVVEGDPSDSSTQTVVEGNGNRHYHFYWNKADETLYYTELDVDTTTQNDVDMNNIHFPDFDPANPDWVKLASHVTDFSADLSQVEEKRVVQLSLTFVEGNKEYVTSNNVTIRNKVGVNDVELDPINKKKKISVTPRDSGVIIEPGEDYHFSTPKVTGENVVDRSVKWSVSGATGYDTGFTDEDNGILHVSSAEHGGNGGKITVTITTNAVDSDGNPASCSLDVYIKRAESIKLAKTYDSDPGNSENRISPGCTFTISADVLGNKLGEVCSVCGSPDIDIDKTVGNTKNGTKYPWVIVDPSSFPGDTSGWKPDKYIDIIENEPDHATFYMHPDAPTYYIENGKKKAYSAVIQCCSLLSVTDNDKGRHYDYWVVSAITVKFWEENDGAVSYGKGLKYGEQTLDKKVTETLPTDYNEYVTAIRVVDNAKVNPQPDRILLHYTIGHGADYRISPDMFDLDLNGSYTFYIQALFPIPEDSYIPGHGGTADDKETIKNEYFNNISNNTAAQGYTGTRYRHSVVYYAKLDKPKVTFRYNGVDYTGENITYDPVNIYMVGKGSGIIGKVEPVRYDNIESNNGLEGMVYSLYKDDTKWYYFDDEKMDYTGDPKLGGNVVEANPKGDPFLKLDGDDRLKACGDYRIVPGVLYQNKLFNHYDIIGYQGFELYAERKTRYYKFDESTIHVNVNADFTMEINDDWFKGQVNFPLPKEIIKNSALFPNPYDMDWKNTSGPLRVEALQTGSNSGTYKTFVYVAYHYYHALDRWEVEPFEVRFDTSAKMIYTHSYGTYVCDRNGSKWEKSLTKGSSTTEKDLICNVKPFWYNNYDGYQTFFPLPTDAGFPFASGAGEITSYELECFDNNMQSQGTLSGLIVTCKKNGDEYEIEFRKETKENNDSNYHKITVVSYGTYTWRPGQTEWTRKKGYGTTYKTDFVPTLRDLKLDDGNTYMMDYPLPSDDKNFPFKNSGEIIKCDDEKAYDQINDAYAANAKEPFKQYVYQGKAIEVEYIVEPGGKHTIRFYKKEKVDSYKWKTTTFGIYEWTSGSSRWNLRSGSAGKVDYSTDFKPTMLININSTAYMAHFPLPSESGFDRYKNGNAEYIGTWDVPLYEVGDEYAEKPKQVNEWAIVKCTQNGNDYTLTISEKRYDGINNVYGIFTCPQNGTQWTKVP